MSPDPHASCKLSPHRIRDTLEKVIRDKDAFINSAKASFKQFDTDNSGTLDFEEVRQLIGKLCSNLQLPPSDDNTLKTIFNRYDTDQNRFLNLEAFSEMYWQLLLRIRDKYYPTKKMRVRRDFFVGRKNLADKQLHITDIFQFIRRLGLGAFGEVHLVQERSSGLTRVCKIINKDRSAVPVEQLEAEVNVVKTLDHPNIIKVFEVLEDYNNMYIIMETCEGGELLERIVTAQQKGRVLSEKYVCELMTQLMNALVYFHERQVAHRDLKPENILFQDKLPNSPIKVIDFGLAELFDKGEEYQKSRFTAGTALYMAPEVFMHVFNVKCDIWSAGVILYFLLTGQLPFIGRTLKEVQFKVCNGKPDYERDCQHLSKSAIDLLKGMLNKNLKQRFSASQALRHEWFSLRHKSDANLPDLIKENMTNYMKQSNLKNVLVNMMAHQLNVSSSQIRQINDIFRGLDQDGNGTLSHQELTEALSRVGIPPWDINRIVQAIDVDDSGNVSYTEFLAACYTWRESELNVVWTAFSKMDKDGDGCISTEEFINVIAGGDQRLITLQELQEAVKEVDKNGDSIVDWDEFLEYIRTA